MEERTASADVCMSSRASLKTSIEKLRDIINSTIVLRQGAWGQRESGNWSKLWCGIDNLKDTQLAVNEFIQLKKYNSLSIYGLLQALIVQQDALKHIGEALDIEPANIDDYPELTIIRKIRNEAVGHPSKTKAGGQETYTTLSKDSNLEKLIYGVWSKQGFQKQVVDLKKIVNDQKDLLKKEISRLIKIIKETENTHRKKFAEQSVADLLTSSSYHIQKLWSFEKDRFYSQINFKQLNSCYLKFKQEIKKRYNLKNISKQGVQLSGLIVIIKHIEKILPRIKKMIYSNQPVDSVNLDVYIESLEHSFEELRQMAKEVDEKFNNKL